MADILSPLLWIAGIVQTLLLVLAAPLFNGWIKCVKCWMQNRRAPSLLQPYRDLRRLFAKEIILAHRASVLFRIAPYVVLGTAMLAASTVPFITVRTPLAAVMDALVLVGTLALGRFFLSLAALDIGTAFGGMGASREMTLAALAEPAMLMVVFTMAMYASSTNLATVVSHVSSAPVALRPSLLFGLLALILIGITETGRVPVDNPATHLELTMVHEAMILEYTGRHLALMELASEIKLMLYAVLVVNLFFPWGISNALAPGALAAGMLAVGVKLSLAGALLAIAENLVAKMRLFRVPIFLAVAFTLAMIGMLSFIMLEGS